MEVLDVHNYYFLVRRGDDSRGLRWTEEVEFGEEVVVFKCVFGREMDGL